MVTMEFSPLLYIPEQMVDVSLLIIEYTSSVFINCLYILTFGLHFYHGSITR